MMGLYIKGLQKPKNCIECYFSGFTKGKGTVCLIDGTRLTALIDENMNAKYVRASVCPLMPIHDHGDLIEKEAAVAVVKLAFPTADYDGFCRATQALQWLVDAPVIIPADRSEDA